MFQLPRFTRVLTIAALLFSISCNKVIDQVEAPPFTVYPNPFSDVFFLQLHVAGPANVRILDGTKNPVHSVENLLSGQPAAFNMAEVDPGVYHIEVTLEGETFIEPILKFE